ncbi:MAG: hypothetical protein IPP79_20635 [Chitinophagaceae bacterium]|nr:hypothetical protein [Chitinophagaceae bacterium]
MHYTNTQAGGIHATIDAYIQLHLSHFLPATLNRVVNFSIENDIALDYNINNKDILNLDEEMYQIYPFINILGNTQKDQEETVDQL